jgi:hypothetical protein
VTDKNTVTGAASCRFGGIVFASLACAASLSAQTGGPTAPSPSGVIAGRVIDDTSEAPVEGVRVTRWLVGANDPRQYETICDSRGRFVFRDVAPGQWRIVAEFPGYAAGAAGRRRPNGPDRLVALTAGGAATGVILRIFPVDAMLSGTVIDERGAPAPGVAVTALRRNSWSSSREDLVPLVTATRTDDRGQYRLRVTEGEYAVVVPGTLVVTTPFSPVDRPTLGLPGQRSMLPADAPGFSTSSHHVAVALTIRPSLVPPLPGGSLPAVYESVFYPSAPFEPGATLLRVDGGTERRDLDLTMRLAPARTVSGRVLGPDGAPLRVGLRLVYSAIGPTANGELDVATAITAADGSFRLHGVPPGDFQLLVDMPRPSGAPTGAALDGGAVAHPMPAAGSTPVGPGPRYWARVAVSVGQADITDVEMRAEHGGRLLGRLVFDGEPQPTGAQIAQRSVFLTPAPGTRLETGPPATTRANERGEFATAAYRPGRYVVNAAAPAGWFLKSATRDGRDIMTTALDLPPGETAGVVVTFSNKAAALTGVVQTPGGSSDPDADVLIFPTAFNAQRDAPPATTRYRQVRVEPNGHFSIPLLAPGEYLVAAIDDRITVNWRDLAVLTAIAREAARVRLVERQTATIILRRQAVR